MTRVGNFSYEYPNACPGCGSVGTFVPIVEPWVWCERCGTVCTPVGAHHKPKSAGIAHEPQPGLLAVAADAVKAANEAMAQVSSASLLRGSPFDSAIESLIEATTAIVHELEARRDDDREPLIAKAIADGVAAVEAERERIARLVEMYKGSSGDVDTVLDRIAKNIRTGRVPS